MAWLMFDAFLSASGSLPCDARCSCQMTPIDVKVTCVGLNITDVPRGLPSNTTKLYLSGTNIKEIQAGTFEMYPMLTELFFRDTSTDPCLLEYLEPGAFAGLHHLEALGFIGCGKLTSMDAGVLGTFENLETLHIYRSGLTAVPDLSLFKTVNRDMEGVMKEIDLHSNRIDKIKAYDFQGIRTDTLNLEENIITRIDGFAFKNATIVNLILRRNEHLMDIHDMAFEGLNELINKIDLSNTKITSLPTKGLRNIRQLRLKQTPTLKHFPTVLEFQKIELAELTYPHHCCAFRNPEKQNPSAWKAKQAQERINKACAITTTPMSKVIPETLPVTVVTDEIPSNFQKWDFVNSDSKRILRGGRTKRNLENFGDLNFDDSDQINSSSIASGFGLFLPGKGSNTDDNGPLLIGPGMTFHRSTVPDDDNLTQSVFCGKIYIYNRNVTCTPEPDAFNPCEDVMGYVWLRVLVWFVLLAALLGNSIVLIVLITSRGKFTVPKFLMCNLAFADFIMGVYLILLASIDVHTLGEYFNYAVQWQNEGGCQAAGFLSVFSSELSIFTLTILTLERWYAISHAIHLNKRMKLRQSMALMLTGYTFATILAMLPLLGISGYGNVSICLPMKADDVLDISYVVSLLVMNGIMFLAICSCYINMYWKVKSSASTARSNDATIAKRMALLVFTNFACWAPIAFFGLTASAGVALIDITNSKILLVFFYPLNSCANPFLYAILTKQFRKDFFILLGKYGICVEKANIYRGTMASRTLSHSRNPKKEAALRRNRLAARETVFTNFGDSHLNTKPNQNHHATPKKVHPFKIEQVEVQPFIKKSHIDRAVEFANKDPVLNDEAVSETWGDNECAIAPGQRHPPYVRSVSDYANFFTSRKCSSTKCGAYTRVRTSVETCFSNSTDTTCISENSHTPDDIWKIREIDDESAITFPTLNETDLNEERFQNLYEHDSRHCKDSACAICLFPDAKSVNDNHTHVRSRLNKTVTFGSQNRVRSQSLESFEEDMQRFRSSSLQDTGEE
ncbi:hypothetical protein DPMN_086716 [Dreissena polymorpha]|uniref:G-protein coupled receptors family 1 profile domain-containing protein n=2 Tax=Dreissena polymorpha TaxID=45954 RepID=A0A9D4KRP9_DREPO|nr:hypothetical protein DPMN_086716 [Dreissena polymorpha]